MNPKLCHCGNPLPHADWVMWESCSDCAHPGAVPVARPGVIELVDVTEFFVAGYVRDGGPA